jgi:hypothetical protein
MPHTRNELLSALRFELIFLENGGYEPSVHRPHKEAVLLRDSPSCLNFAAPVREHPCAACWLIDSVPSARYGENVPCHHIPLDETGATIADGGDTLHMREAVRKWLRATIRQLEAEERAEEQTAKSSLASG